MAYPLLYYETFPLGTAGQFDSETDTDSKLTWTHYPTITRRILTSESSWRSPYVMDIDLSLGTADAVVTETGSLDTAASATLGIGFAFLATGLTMAASDRFTILAVDSAGPVVEGAISIRNNAGTIELVGDETGASATIRTTPLIQGVWHWLEVLMVVDSGGGNDGTLQFFVDGQQVGTTITTLDQAAISQVRLGAIGIDAGTTAGRLLFSHIVGDNARVGLYDRFPKTKNMAIAGSDCLIGPGRVLVRISGTSTDALALLYDTDDPGAARSRGKFLGALQNISNSANEGEFQFEHGLYMELSGTNPLMNLELEDMRVLSRGSLKTYALTRTPIL